MLLLLAVGGCDDGDDPADTGEYPIHRGITVTWFYVGEAASADNGFIANAASAWDGNWVAHYGGVDDPYSRNGYHPAGFVPRENPFYFALPYNDFNADGQRRDDAATRVYWSGEQDWGPRDSMCKNRWIRIHGNGRTAYAQWQDVGPFETDDGAYVFGSAEPRNPRGLDVSPAVRDYLGLADMDTVSWRFVREDDVPEGPWRDIVTTSPVDW